MSLFSSSSRTTTNGSSSPTGPAEVQGGIIDFMRLINSLGNRDPNQYVSGPSNLQSAAFSMGSRIANRYGANFGFGSGGSTPQGGAPVGIGGGAYQWGAPGLQPISGGGQTSGGGTLFGQSGVQPEGQRDFAAYVQNHPDLLNTFNNLSERDRDYISRTHGDGSGRVSLEDYGRFHWDFNGEAEGRQMPTAGGAPAPTGGGSVPVGGGGSPTQGWAQPNYGYTMADDVGLNPVTGYRDAANMARTIGAGGANRADLFTMDDRVDMGSAAHGTAHTTNTGGANLASAHLMNDGVNIGPAAQGSAQRGIGFSKDYENQYTDDVVNTTLASFDEEAGRRRAAEAAEAAGNNAFGGSRFAIQRAVTEEQIARERASQEANLRFGAQDRAFGLGMQDADRFTSTSLANADLANQQSRAQGQLDFNRLLANQDAQNLTSRFNASQRDTADNRLLAEADRLTSTSLANAQMDNQRTEAQAGLDFNRLLANLNAQNDNSRFNASQEDVADSRSLAAAGQLADISGQAADTERADLASILALGDREREIDQQGRTADLRLMELMAQLYGMTPLDVVTGQRYSETGVRRDSPSAISNIKDVLDIGGRVASIFG